MSSDTQELVRTVEQLPEAKRVAVADFAKFLLSQQDDQRWESSTVANADRLRMLSDRVSADGA